MAYKVVFSARAQHDLQAILDDDSGRYTPIEQLNYVVGLERRARRLDLFPKRGNSVAINGSKYWRLNYKAHTAFYRVLDAEQLVVVVAVLHSAMDHSRQL